MRKVPGWRAMAAAGVENMEGDSKPIGSDGKIL